MLMAVLVRISDVRRHLGFCTPQVRPQPAQSTLIVEKLGHLHCLYVARDPAGASLSASIAARIASYIWL
jgi:hypothetical protein